MWLLQLRDPNAHVRVIKIRFALLLNGLSTDVSGRLLCEP